MGVVGVPIDPFVSMRIRSGVEGGCRVWLAIIDEYCNLWWAMRPQSQARQSNEVGQHVLNTQVRIADTHELPDPQPCCQGAQHHSKVHTTRCNTTPHILPQECPLLAVREPAHARSKCTHLSLMVRVYVGILQAFPGHAHAHSKMHVIIVAPLASLCTAGPWHARTNTSFWEVECWCVCVYVCV